MGIVKNVSKDKDIIKRIEKTREERKVDLAKEKEQRDTEERARRRKVIEEEKRQQKEQEKKNAEERDLKGYVALQHLEKSSNVGVSQTGSVEECKQIEEDFM